MKKSSAIIVDKRYFQDENDLFLFAQWMKENDGIQRYQWRLYRCDYGCWHSFAQDGAWRVDQKASAEDGLEILTKEWLKGIWFRVNYTEANLMIAGNTDIEKAKENIIDLIRSNYPELTVKFV